MPITLDGSSLTIEKLVAIARNGEQVELAPDALERIKTCRRMLEEKLLGEDRGRCSAEVRVTSGFGLPKNGIQL